MTEPADLMRSPGRLVGSLTTCLTRGGSFLEMVPGIVKDLIAVNAQTGKPGWREFTTPLGDRIEYAEHDFEQFVKKAPLSGLGGSIAALERACSDDRDAMAALDEALRRPAHRPARKAQPDPEPDDADPKTVDNINSSTRPDGTSQRQALRRLRKDRPDLLERVKARELSPHAAMVLAGFRPATLTLRLTEPERVAAAILRKAETDPIVAQAVALIADRRPCAHCGN